jgi:hypothetical protein
MIVLGSGISSAAASQDILDRGRCTSNVPDLVSKSHAPHAADRLTFSRF